MSNNVVVPEIGFKNSLKKHNLVYTLIEQVAERIKQIPEHGRLRVEIELIKTSVQIIH